MPLLMYNMAKTINQKNPNPKIYGEPGRYAKTKSQIRGGIS